MRIHSAISVILLLASYAIGQYGTAPNGYYPSSYDGLIFSGSVTAVDEASGQIAVTLKDKKKPQAFVGWLQRPCAVPSKDGKAMTASDLPIGTDVTVYFRKDVRKDVHKDGRDSREENLIIGIMFHSWDGHAVRPTAKKMYLCSDAPISSYLRCFSSRGAGCTEQIDPISPAH